ncbi:MAG TPA: class I SAM-dependent methyltransferase [Acetobacteraceae bacterium]|jgi:2-polyprenyl-3-methyl-5-hydroxy-6-metoxy-1,4-benzoquinol methylase
MSDPQCRFCGSALSETFADLGMSPLSNAFIAPDGAARMEPFYPLHAYVCGTCFLVQLQQYESPQAIFGDYSYFSSYSESWLQHAEAYVAEMADRFALGAGSHMLEIASNDGYLLQYALGRGLSVLGIEPAANVAAVAVGKGIPTEVAFFGEATARALRARGVTPDVIVANNVMAHVPDLNDFVRGLAVLLPPDSVLTVEFPHLLRLIRQNQFDTIYHEHFSYFSLLVVQRVFARHGLRVFDVAELPTHGGSLRVFVSQQGSARHQRQPAVDAVLADETKAGLNALDAYRRFGAQLVRIKCDLVDFCIRTQRAGKRMVGYGAPAKGNTLLNYCGIGREFLPFTVDRSPHKQGMLLPGTRIPIRAPEEILKAKPDYVLILPWNLRDEIMQQMQRINGWGGRFVVPIPRLAVL